MKITAVIPIRKGSQRVVGKNLRSFAGSNLLEIKIENLKKVKSIDEIIVNTDSEEAIEIAKKQAHQTAPVYILGMIVHNQYIVNIMLLLHVLEVNSSSILGRLLTRMFLLIVLLRHLLLRWKQWKKLSKCLKQIRNMIVFLLYH